MKLRSLRPSPKRLAPWMVCVLAALLTSACAAPAYYHNAHYTWSERTLTYLVDHEAELRALINGHRAHMEALQAETQDIYDELGQLNTAHPEEAARSQQLYLELDRVYMKTNTASAEYLTKLQAHEPIFNDWQAVELLTLDERPLDVPFEDDAALASTFSCPDGDDACLEGCYLATTYTVRLYERRAQSGGQWNVYRYASCHAETTADGMIFGVWMRHVKNL